MIIQYEHECSKKNFKKCYIHQKQLCVYLVASWACEVNQLDAKIRNK